MTNNKSSDKRRQLLKSIAAGSGAVIAGKNLPENWSRPVVNSVMLPAHAQTSYREYAAIISSLGRNDPGVLQAQDDGRLLDSLVPSAHAQAPLAGDYLCIRVTGSIVESRFSRVYNANEINEYGATGGSLGVEFSLPLIGGCGNAITPNITVTNPGPTSVEFFLNLGDVTVNGTLPVDDCSIVPLGVCNVVSDRSIKAGFSAVDEQEILRKVANLSIETWNYTDRQHGVRHIGPMAQDFMAAFNVGDSDRHINMVDANGVNLAAIKALYARLEEKETQISALQEKLAAVIEKLEKLG